MGRIRGVTRILDVRRFGAVRRDVVTTTAVLSCGGSLGKLLGAEDQRARRRGHPGQEQRNRDRSSSVHQNAPVTMAPATPGPTTGTTLGSAEGFDAGVVSQRISPPATAAPPPMKVIVEPVANDSERALSA